LSAPGVLHLLPHRGGGGDSYVGLLERLDGYAHDRAYLSRHVRATAALPSLAAGWPRAARAAREADLVHVHGDTATLLAIPALRGRPWVWTTHGLHMLRRARGPRRALVAGGLRRAVRSASASVCTSSAELAELAALVGGRPEAANLERVIVGIEPAAAEPDARSSVRAELELGDTTTVCLFAGSLEPRKEPLLAARAALEARAAGAEITLIVAGDGPLRGELEKLAGETVRLLGFRDDLGRLMAASDVFVMPSTREGLPLALLEAMSHGLVPVVAREPGSVEAIGDAGVSIPPGDVRALATALAELARDPSRQQRLGEAARERREREFGLNRFLGEMDAIYSRALLV
jgi:glycosyltransferase involved in cell wall biosynthesis